MNNLTSISNVFFVVGVVLIATGALGLISANGGFMGLKYLWYWLTDGIGKKQVDKSRKDYYTYQKDFYENAAKGSKVMKISRIVFLVAGVVCVVISLIVAMMV